ncbi:MULTISPECIES: glutathione S-transferase family protein [Rhizobium/Agrobacterium group]|uniref:glutathione S-transferase family protein n=1 Tax=Rhizobium/Agrobacterium group TaxID=227290 RepID=UPI0015721C33|nr:MULTISPECIES: glutathione S-transferase family protein [Rhizobium/Agrobacterium group]MCF1474049.1 glutathione S-transferase family protein [Allorhizobium ampelinum]NSZ51235.1 glutathione S-transferase family protein [Agrobacterium vitis]NTA33236.1 glutathione S-transferase family protein [Agrobacterium vitis]
MTDLTLYIANKNYSSWSFRPWIALTAAGIDFKEVLIRFDFPAGNPSIKAISPTGQVPVLVHGDVKVWESLAIIEYAAELFPNAGIWPSAQSDRAVARAISLEMLAGFRALRNACPMNFRRPPQALAFSPETQAAVMADVSRIETIWREQLDRSGGPFLFGAFSAADAMYAPVVNRFSAYQLTADPVSLAYMDRMQAHSAWIKWRDAALAEPWIVPEDEA